MLNRIRRRIVLAILLSFCVIGGARADSDKRVAKVMTVNMDAGTDLGFMLYFLTTDPMLGAQLTYQELAQSQIPERAGLVADTIAAEQPYLVSLQEATLWRTGPTAESATDVLYDQLALLLSALASRGQYYQVAATQNLLDAAVPMSETLALRFTDRDVILVRSDLPQSRLDLSNVRTGRYQATFEFEGIPVPRGWMSVDVKMRGKQFRFVNTHLETPYPGIPAATEIQVAQADELIGIMAATDLPVVLAGDFNANASAGPDQSDATVHILNTGYQDTWLAAHPGEPGYTWPLFWEDFYAGSPVLPFERIDLIYARGLDILDVRQTGLSAPWGSDHAGVTATVEIGH